MKCFVFVETTGGIRNRFVGFVSSDLVRWALARRYPWLEYAFAHALKQCGLPQFDATTNSLSEHYAGLLVQNFLSAIRIPSPVPSTIPFPDPSRLPEQVQLGTGISEYAKWLDAARTERLLSRDLNDSSVVLLPNKTLNDLAPFVLRKQGRFVAIVDQDKRFRSLIDRSAALENLANEVLKQTDLLKNSIYLSESGPSKRNGTGTADGGARARSKTGALAPWFTRPKPTFQLGSVVYL
jgi:hypothetical protein